MKRRNDNSWFTMKKENDSAEIMIYNDIGYFGISAESFAKKLAELGELKNITVRINSYGGEVFDGFAIFNRLRENKAHKTVVIDGVAASIASVIAMAGDEIKMPKNAFFMIHDPSIFIAGTSKDLNTAANLLDELKKKVIQTYRKRAKELSEKEISEMMEKETWINAEDAVIYGFADEVVDETENEEPATNKGIKLPENMKEIFLSLNKSKPAGMHAPRMNGGGKVMHQCPHCKKEIAEGSVFCNHCGKAINQAPAVTQSQVDTAAQAAAHKREMDEARMSAGKMERERVVNISAACKKHKMSAEFEKELIDSGYAYDKCAQKILDKLDDLAPVQPPQISVTKDGGEKFRTHLANSLAVSSGLITDKAIVDEVKKDVQVSTLHGAMRMCLQKAGIDHSAMTPDALADRTLRMIATGSSDLPAALEAVTNKALAAGYNEAPTTFQLWAGTREVTDFKTNTIVSVSNFGDLDILPEGSPFKDGKISDKKETFSIDTKGKKFTISRKALINDDVDVFSRIPRLMGNAIPRKINRDIYDKLTYNTLVGPNMVEDGVALFNASSHNNLIANSGVVSVSSIGAAQRKLMEMPLPKPEPDSVTQYANITGRYLVTGSANMVSIMQILGSGMDISKSIPGVLNPYANGVIIPIFDAYLQSLLTAASKANAWYLMADQMAMESLGVAYLRGNRTPTFRSANSGVGEALGIAYDIYFDWGIYVADYRGVIHNDGVTAG